MKIKLEEGAFSPVRAHDLDAGYDLCARDERVVPAGKSALFDTGVCVQLPKNTAGIIVSRSGMNVKNDITSTGLIDPGYTGSIKVKLYNHGKVDYYVKPGERISQLVIVSIKTPEIEVVDSLEETERGDSGFGSTGK